MKLFHHAAQCCEHGRETHVVHLVYNGQHLHLVVPALRAHEVVHQLRRADHEIYIVDHVGVPWRLQPEHLTSWSVDIPALGPSTVGKPE